MADLLEQPDETIAHFDDWMKEQRIDGYACVRELGVVFDHDGRMATPHAGVIERMAQGYKCSACGEDFVSWVPSCPVCRTPNQLTP